MEAAYCNALGSQELRRQPRVRLRRQVPSQVEALTPPLWQVPAQPPHLVRPCQTVLLGNLRLRPGAAPAQVHAGARSALAPREEVTETTRRPPDRAEARLRPLESRAPSAPTPWPGPQGHELGQRRKGLLSSAPWERKTAFCVQIIETPPQSIGSSPPRTPIGPGFPTLPRPISPDLKEFQLMLDPARSTLRLPFTASTLAFVVLVTVVVGLGPEAVKASGATYDLPRSEATLKVDAHLDEPAWQGRVCF